MTRAPKFRAWSKTEKKMLKHIQEINFEFNGELIGIESENLNYHGANEIELMQSTGLKDKNGVEIFEGDVVLWNDWKKIEVSFGSQTVEENFGDIRIFQGFNLCLGGGYPEPVMSTFEVIGNIYENKELLE